MSEAPGSCSTALHEDHAKATYPSMRTYVHYDDDMDLDDALWRFNDSCTHLMNSTILLPCRPERACLQSLELTDLSCVSFTKEIGFYRPSSRLNLLRMMQRIFVLPESCQKQATSHVA